MNKISYNICSLYFGMLIDNWRVRDIECFIIYSNGSDCCYIKRGRVKYEQDYLA